MTVVAERTRIPGNLAVGPRTREQFARMIPRKDGSGWRQGEHVIVSGHTGSGKTALTRMLDQIRIDAGGAVIVFVGKVLPDETITRDYRGWTRWTEWHEKRRIDENRILLWPKTEGKDVNEARGLQRRVFRDAIKGITRKGNWTVHFDEGLYMCDPRMLGLADEVGAMHYMGRSSGITIIDCIQRPAHFPIIAYSSASHAFVGNVTEATDVKRLSELGGRKSGKEIGVIVRDLGKHDFLHINTNSHDEPEIVNLRS